MICTVSQSTILPHRSTFVRVFSFEISSITWKNGDLSLDGSVNLFYTGNVCPLNSFYYILVHAFQPLTHRVNKLLIGLIGDNTLAELMINLSLMKLVLILFQLLPPFATT
jgi:hypothetical protein